MIDKLKQHWLAVIIIVLVFVGIAWAANSKLTALTANTTPAATDILYIVDDPGGTPLSQYITYADILDLGVTTQAYNTYLTGIAGLTPAEGNLLGWDESSNIENKSQLDIAFAQIALWNGLTVANGFDRTLDAGDPDADYTIDATGNFNMQIPAADQIDASGNVIFPVSIGVAASDETTALTTGESKITFRAPYAFTLTEVRANVNTAPTGASITVDIEEGGTTVLSTLITIDVSELTSESAETPPVISDSAIADDASLTIDIDVVGSTIAGKGLKIWLIGTRTL